MRSKKQIAEEYLVISARLGDRRATGQLVALCGPRLLGHAARLLGNREEARDVVQDAWIDILRGLGGLTEPRAFSAWSTRIVTRRCAKHIKGRQRQRSLAQEIKDEHDTHIRDAGPDAADAAAIRRAISRLPPAHAATMALVYVGDMTLAEAAVALDVPLGTVKTRLMHAREKLKTALTGDADEQT